MSSLTTRQQDFEAALAARKQEFEAKLKSITDAGEEYEELAKLLEALAAAGARLARTDCTADHLSPEDVCSIDVNSGVVSASIYDDAGDSLALPPVCLEIVARYIPAMIADLHTAISAAITRVLDAHIGLSDGAKDNRQARGVRVRKKTTKKSKANV